MKATIDQHGTLILEPESGLESYALSNWADSKRNFVTYAYAEDAKNPEPHTVGTLCREEQTQ